MSDGKKRLLRMVEPGEVRRELRPPVSGETLAAASEIVEGVRLGGAGAVRGYEAKFGSRGADEPLVLDKAAMLAAVDVLDPADVAVLLRAAARIEAFARAQRDSLAEIDVAVPGGRAGHTIEPVSSAGCYAPGGRYPLPSSVLMTGVTARVAGVERVVVASPSVHPAMLAAASIAGADEFLAVGGAHGIAALAYGVEGLDRVDVIAGPGNAWVTAAKQLVSGVVGIDMLAGPSELLVLADGSADADVVAADLLAQAEHDADAVPMLVTTSAGLADEVESALQGRLEKLATRETASAAIVNGFVCVSADEAEAVRVVNLLAPEHLEILTGDSEATALKIRNAGALFVGGRSAEVFGDYGAGPNHTLPTGGTARFSAGLSVMHFLRHRTWMRLDGSAGYDALRDDTVRLAGIEGLAGHAASAAARGG